MRAPDYDWGDLVYFAGLLAGLGLTCAVLPRVGVTHQLACLIGGLLVGAGIGYFLEQRFRAWTGMVKRERRD
jgi:hypothetical protein